MDKTKIGVIAATAILGLGALGGAAVKASASSNPVKSATPPVAVAATTSEKPGSEASVNDGPGGHADAPGDANADHQFEGVE